MKNHSSKSTYNNGVSLLNHIKYEHLLAGVSGGAISTLILHPLDLMKIRFAGELSPVVIKIYFRIMHGFSK